MGKEICQRLMFFASMLPKDDGFFSLIRSLRMLTFLFFGVSTVNIRLGSSPTTKQLSESDMVVKTWMPQWNVCWQWRASRVTQQIGHVNRRYSISVNAVAIFKGSAPLSECFTCSPAGFGYHSKFNYLYCTWPVGHCFARQYESSFFFSSCSINLYNCFLDFFLSAFVWSCRFKKLI